MRLNAYLAKAGLLSRRGADELIKAGKIKVNGRLGQLNDDVTESDAVEVTGQHIKLRKSRYILLFKPAGVVTTLKDPQGRRKVTDLIDIPERVVPVGRLDYDTSGVLLLTNDGQLAHKLMHPSFKAAKTYEAVVEGQITNEKNKRLENGILLDEVLTAPAKARSLGGTKIELTIHEGRKHQVKRMLAAVGLPVKSLHRSNYAGLTLSGLKPGQWRELSRDEIQKLR